MIFGLFSKSRGVNMETLLKLPIYDTSQLESLSVGDLVYIEGIVVTLRDLGHRRALEYLRKGIPLPIDLRGLAVFHAGPIAVKRGNQWNIVSIGPTTSARMDQYVYELIARTGVRIIIGKGGMGLNARRACRDHRAIYVELVGGTASLITKSIVEVVDVYWTDLGIPEAMWVLKVQRLGPAIIVIDTKGNDLHEDVMKKAEQEYKKIIQSI